MNLTKKILIGAGMSVLLYKVATKVIAYRDMGKNLKFDLTFNRVQEVYVKDLQLRARIILNLIIHNTSPASYNIKNFVSTVYNSTEEYQIATTKPVNLSIPPYKSIAYAIDFDLNIFAFASGMTEKYIIKVVNKLEVLGFQIKTPSSEINIASYLKTYINALEWVKQYVTRVKSGQLFGLNCIKNLNKTELLN